MKLDRAWRQGAVLIAAGSGAETPGGNYSDL